MLSPLTGSLGPVWFPRRALTYEQKLLAGLSGIVAYWPLTPDRWSEGAGGIVDVSGNGRHGTNNGATPDAVDGPSAAMGRAPSFVAAENDRINIFSSSLATAINPNAPLSIIAWVKVQNAAVWTNGLDQNIVDLYSTGSRRIGLWKGGTTYANDLIVQWNGGAVPNYSGFDTATLEWVPLIGVLTGTQVQLYVNGVAGASVAYTPLAFTISGAYISQYGGGGGGYPFLGNIGHVLILDHAATADERALINDPN